MSTLSPSWLDDLRAALGDAAVVTDPERIAPHLVEWRGRYRGETPVLLQPDSTDAVAAAVRACRAAGLAITPQGGNTGLVGGQIPAGEALLSLRRMNRIRRVDALDDALVAEAGVVLATAQEAAAAAGRLFPLSLGSQGSATIGGLISTNAGGVHVVRYGMMRDLVLGLEAVLADGTVWNGLKTLRKDNTGYDLKQLFIGAEGTLGIVTAAALKLFPQPGERVTAMVGLMSADAALTLLTRLKARSGAVAAFELMNRLSVDLATRHLPGVRDPFAIAPAWLALIELEGAAGGGLEETLQDCLAEAMEDGLAVDAALAQSAAQAQAWWRLREGIPAAHRLEGAQVNHDIATPVSATPRFLAEAEIAVRALHADARIVAFGHAGDGNIHYTALAGPGVDAAAFPGEAIVAAVQGVAHRLDGSISAEHGIGVARRAELPHYKDAASLGLMRAVKRALDPDGVMNPRALIG